MSVPTLKVEIAFASTPLDTTPTWVDVTQYVRYEAGITIRRGRASELDAFSAGTITLTLSNRDRLFDPSYTPGTYYGNLKPGKQIRITATWSAVDYDVFTGWVTGWPQDFPHLGKDATVTIQGHDAIGWMAKNRLPSDYVYTYADAAADPGDLTLFLRRTSDYLWLDETANSDGATLEYGRRESGSSLMLGSVSPSIQFDAATVWRVTTPFDSSTGQWTVAFVMQTTYSSDTGSVDILGNVPREDLGLGTIGGSQISMLGDGHIAWTGGTATLNDTVQTSVSVNDGRPHLVVVTGDGSGTEDDVTIYVDGAAVPVVRGGIGSGYGQMSVAFVGDAGPTPRTTPTVFTGTIQDVACWATILTDAAVETLWWYVSGYLEESAYSRFERYLDEAGWPSAWRDNTDDKRAECGQLVFGGRQVIDAMQELERTEQGRIFATKANDPTFLQRYHTTEVTRGNTVQVTFSDDGSGVGYSTFGFRFDDLDIQNDVTVTAAQHGYGRHIDLTSIDDYGPQQASVDTVLTSPTLAEAMAEGLVHQRADPIKRLNPITIRAIPDSLWDNVLGLELGDRIAVEITPMAVGSQVQEEMILEGISWQINTHLWQLTVTGAPAPPDFFVLDSSALDGADVLGF